MKSLAWIYLSAVIIIGILVANLGSNPPLAAVASSQAMAEVPQQVFQDVLVAPNPALNTHLGVNSATGQAADPKDVALAFTQRTSLLAADAQLTWAIESSEALDSNTTVVRLTQMKAQIPVFGAQLAVQVAGDSIHSVAGTYMPSVAANTKPELTVEDAFKIARQALMEASPADALPAQQAGLEQTLPLVKPVLADNELVFFNEAMFAGPALPTALAYRLVVNEADGSASMTVIVDAGTGKILLRFANFHSARNRIIRDANGVETQGTICNQENGSVGTPSTDCDAAFEYAGATYDNFFNTFARDSYDNGGATLTTVVRYGREWNAFWDGEGTVVLGPGFANRDVVAHEWAHAVTQYTADLIYANQSGALNESFSDIFGAMVDREDWLMGEDSPMGAIRSLANPPAYGDPDKVSSYTCTPGDDGGVHTNSGIPNKVAYLMADGGTFNGRTITGIGRGATEQIFYRALVGDLVSSSDFNGLYDALLSAAAALYGPTSAEYTATQTAAQAAELNLAIPCGGTVTADAYETDNSAAQATTITSGTVQDHNFHMAGDQDWLQFSAAVGSTYTIATQNLQASADTVLTLYGTNGATQLAANDDIGGTRASQLTWTATANGTFYIRVSSYGGLGGANRGYQVQLTAAISQTAPDAFEVDNTQATAKAITVGGAIQDHNFHLAGDQDWVTFSAVAGTAYVIETSNLGAACDTILALYTSNGVLLASNDDTNGLASRIAWTAAADGSYAVKVWHFLATRAGDETNYSLRVSGTVFTGDSYEADNSRVTASAITIGGAAQSHTFHMAGDEDWVHFSADPANAYVIETTNLASGNDTVLELYNSSGTLLGYNDDYNGLASRISMAVSNNLPLFVKVRHFSASQLGACTRHGHGHRHRHRHRHRHPNGHRYAPTGSGNALFRLFAIDKALSFDVQSKV